MVHKGDCSVFLNVFDDIDEIGIMHRNRRIPICQYKYYRNRTLPYL